MTISPMSLRKSLRSTKFKVVRFYPASFENEKSLKELIVKTFWNISRMYQNSWWRLGQICLVHITSLGYVTRKMPWHGRIEEKYCFSIFTFDRSLIDESCMSVNYSSLLSERQLVTLHYYCSLEHTPENRNRIVRHRIQLLEERCEILSSPWLKYLRKSRLV